MAERLTVLTAFGPLNCLRFTADKLFGSPGRDGGGWGGSLNVPSVRWRVLSWAQAAISVSTGRLLFRDGAGGRGQVKSGIECFC